MRSKLTLDGDKIAKALDGRTKAPERGVRHPPVD
jgi:hypothetical protein